MKNNTLSIYTILVFLLLFSISAFADDSKNPELNEAQAAVEKICLSLKPFLERPDKVRNIKVDKDSEINAYADNKNDITMFMGMVNFVRDENEIAAVCGHEMAHISGQHIKRSIFTSVISTIASEAIGGTAGDIAGSALYNKESRKHEREADSRGLLYIWKAGYDPRAIWKFWQSLENVYEQGNTAIAKYFGSHPVNKERVENLKVLLVRDCKTWPDLKYCDVILNDAELVNLFNQFESRK
jgi:predicted Zn-dependent protease